MIEFDDDEGRGLALFIFNRDLRIQDNTALNAALRADDVDRIAPIFVFTKEQVSSANKYRSASAIAFMLEVLEELCGTIGIKFFYCSLSEIGGIIKDISPRFVYFNADYTPFAIKRQKKIEKAAKEIGSKCRIFEDALLQPIDEAGEYKIFTAFYKYAAKIEVPRPLVLKNIDKIEKKCSGKGVLAEVRKLIEDDLKESPHVVGGRKAAKGVIREFTKGGEYVHDYPAILTSNLSAYIKFGCLSIREVYHEIGDSKLKAAEREMFLRQLYWRDFYHRKMYRDGFAQDEYKKIKWAEGREEKKLFKKWCRGETGFPIVDAAMRQIAATGYMHNRCRMIVAYFLIYDLHINWRLGEKYFAENLIDYDPANNCGNWRWVLESIGRIHNVIFNPWEQQKKYDYDCEYIKYWIPELRDVPPNHIHKWWQKYGDYASIGYGGPILVHSEEKSRAFKMFGYK